MWCHENDICIWPYSAFLLTYLLTYLFKFAFRRVEGLSSLRDSLKSLVLTFNEITRIEGVSDGGLKVKPSGKVDEIRQG